MMQRVWPAILSVRPVAKQTVRTNNGTHQGVHVHRRHGQHKLGEKRWEERGGARAAVVLPLYNDSETP